MTTPTDPPIRLLAKFEQLFPMSTPQLLVQAPGREMWAAANYNGKPHCRVYSAESSAQTAFTYQSAKRKQTIFRRPLPPWARYIAGISLLIDIAEMPGVDVVVCGNEPPGPRYDFALGILFGAFWLKVNGQPVNEAELIELTDRVRREYVGG